MHIKHCTSQIDCVEDYLQFILMIMSDNTIKYYFEIRAHVLWIALKVDLMSRSNAWSLQICFGVEMEGPGFAMASYNMAQIFSAIPFDFPPTPK